MDINALKHLNDFTGTESYYRMSPFPLVITDGAKFLADNADAYWLMMEIAGAQNIPAIKNDEALQGMQFWELRPNANGKGAVLACNRDEGDEAWRKEIEFTDFPFDAMPNRQARIWVAPTSLDGRKTIQVAYLPSEH